MVDFIICFLPYSGSDLPENCFEILSGKGKGKKDRNIFCTIEMLKSSGKDQKEMRHASTIHPRRQ
jgi:hypothetical protein